MLGKSSFRSGQNVLTAPYTLHIGTLFGSIYMYMKGKDICMYLQYFFSWLEFIWTFCLRNSFLSYRRSRHTCSSLYFSPFCAYGICQQIMTTSWLIVVLVCLSPAWFQCIFWACFFFPGPPNFFISRHCGHWPQSLWTTVISQASITSTTTP